MPKTNICIFFILFSMAFHSQTGIDTQLKSELDEIYKFDQFLREYSNSSLSESRKNEISAFVGYSRNELNANLWKIINKQDSINLNKVERIIEKYGYPGKTLVGEPTNKATWYVIQHSKKINHYFPLIKKAGKKREIPMTLVAKMEDRMLMYEGKEQVYGTQGAGRMIYDENGNEKFFQFIWPIQDSKSVNKRRKDVGFTSTIEESARELDIPYVNFSMEDYKKLKLVEMIKH